MCEEHQFGDADARTLRKGSYSAWLKKAKGDSAKAKWLVGQTTRYFTIDFEQQLFYYSHSMEYKKISHPIPFQEILGAERLPPSTKATKKKQSNQSCGFIVRTTERTFELNTTSNADAAQWVYALNAARDAVKSAAGGDQKDVMPLSGEQPRCAAPTAQEVVSKEPPSNQQSVKTAFPGSQEPTQAPTAKAERPAATPQLPSTRAEVADAGRPENEDPFTSLEALERLAAAEELQEAVEPSQPSGTPEALPPMKQRPPTKLASLEHAPGVPTVSPLASSAPGAAKAAVPSAEPMQAKSPAASTTAPTTLEADSALKAVPAAAEPVETKAASLAVEPQEKASEAAEPQEAAAMEPLAAQAAPSTDEPADAAAISAVADLQQTAAAAVEPRAAAVSELAANDLSCASPATAVDTAVEDVLPLRPETSGTEKTAAKDERAVDGVNDATSDWDEDEAAAASAAPATDTKTAAGVISEGPADPKQAVGDSGWDSDEGEKEGNKIAEGPAKSFPTAVAGWDSDDEADDEKNPPARPAPAKAW